MLRKMQVSFPLRRSAPEGRLVSDISKKLGRHADIMVVQIYAEVAKGPPFGTMGDSFPAEDQLSIDQLTRNIDFGVQLAGEVRRALGSGFDGATLFPREMNYASECRKITKALVGLDYCEQRFRRISGERLLRVIQEVTE